MRVREDTFAAHYHRCAASGRSVYWDTPAIAYGQTRPPKTYFAITRAYHVEVVKADNMATSR